MFQFFMESGLIWVQHHVGTLDATEEYILDEAFKFSLVEEIQSTPCCTLYRTDAVLEMI